MNLGLDNRKSIVHGFEVAPNAWLRTKVGFRRNATGQIVNIIEC
jgi:hypothetical protein